MNDDHDPRFKTLRFVFRAIHFREGCAESLANVGPVD
jgi:hypothetical protein